MKGKEIAKSIVLIFLIFSMIFIYGFNWVYRLDREELMRGQSWVTGFARYLGLIQNIDQTALSVEVQPAAYPLRMAVRDQETLYGVSYNKEALTVLYQKVLPVLTGALESARDAGTVADEKYKEALKKQMVYLGYDGEIPFYAISEWVGAASLKEYDFSARHIILADEDGMLSIYVRGAGKSSAYRISTQASSESLLKMIGEYPSGNAAFAFERGDSLSAVEPETILFSDAPAVTEIKRSVPSFFGDGQEMLTLLEAFSYNPYTVKNYRESDETMVYVENLSTLRVKADGTIEFLVSDPSGGIPVSGIFSGEKSMLSVVRMIEAARFLTDRVSGNVRLDASYYLQGYRFDDKTQTYTITFGMEVSGIPVLMEDGPASEIQIRDGAICAATFHVRAYQKTAISNYLLPQEQATAAYLPRQELNGALWVRYEDRAEERIKASYFIS